MSVLQRFQGHALNQAEDHSLRKFTFCDSDFDNGLVTPVTSTRILQIPAGPIASENEITEHLLLILSISK